MTNLFELAARNKFRFASARGLLTVEQLFDLPLTSKTGPSLDGVARAVNADLKNVTEESFVETKSNPEKTELGYKLELVKGIIAIRQAENAAAADRADRAAKRQRLLAALDAAETREMSQASIADLRKQLEELN